MKYEHRFNATLLYLCGERPSILLRRIREFLKLCKDSFVRVKVDNNGLWLCEDYIGLNILTPNFETYKLEEQFQFDVNTTKLLELITSSIRDIGNKNLKVEIRVERNNQGNWLFLESDDCLYMGVNIKIVKPSNRELEEEK